MIKKYPHIVCGWCGAHMMDLLMEDIGKLEFFASAIIEAKKVVKFIRNHQYTDDYFKNVSEFGLLFPADTRFASAFIMLQRRIQVKDAVMDVRGAHFDC